MTKVDQFESAFRSAAKAVYAYGRPEISKILVVTDLEATEAESFTYQNRQFLAPVAGEAEWVATMGADYGNVAELLEIVEREKPSLVLTYRHLQSNAWKWPFSLGEYLDVLTQAAGLPVLVVPHPTRGGAMEHALSNTDVVMAITDHLTGDDNLVNYAARFTMDGGTLYLTHVENKAVFRRYVETISKIPSIDTDEAKETILAQLLKEPHDFIHSCRQKLGLERPQMEVREIVALGNRLEEYKRMIEEHEVDLLVMNTKDEYQAAMHGLAYPLAVELRSIPLLLL